MLARRLFLLARLMAGFFFVMLLSAVGNFVWGFPPDFVCIVLFAPLLISEATGLGFIPVDQGVLFGGPMALLVNTLLWAFVVFELWWLYRWVSDRVAASKGQSADGSGGTHLLSSGSR